MTNIFENLGIPIDYVVIGALALILIMFIMLIVALSKISKMQKDYEALTHGKKGVDLESVIVSAFSDMDKIRKNDNKRAREYMQIRDNMSSCFRKTGLVKYDAFNQMSGTLSFSLALLNEKNDGVILNCMHSREGCFTYAKEIIGGESYVVLSDEEKAALKQAIDSENVLADE